MKLRLILVGTGWLCLSWNSVALAQLASELNENVIDLSICTKRFSSSGTEVPTTNLCYFSDIQFQDEFPIAQAELAVNSETEEITAAPNPITPLLQVAQNNPDLPPGVLEPTRPPLSPLPSIPSPSPTPPSPLTSPSEPLPTAPSDLNSRVKVKRVEVLGSTVFSPQQLQDVVAPFIGKDATFE
ncbi:MAG TPA: hypothetical protein V6C95_20415, partial [Coleofasciculaceae cyanobacterium]